MPYIGHGVTNAGTFYILDDLTMSSSTTYTMQVGGVSVTPKADNLLITLDGVVQHTPDAYTVSGSTITFASAPGSGVDFYGIIMGQSASIGQGSIGADELKVSGDGTNGQVLTSDGDGTFSWATDTEAYVPLAGGTMTGTLAMGSNDITGTGDIGGTLTTAAQTNITSVGTLTTLTVDDMTLNGSTISDAGAFDIDAGGVIKLDAGGGQIQFFDDGTEIGVLENSSSDFVIESKVQDKDILFKGNDGGTGIELMRMNMSGANVGISTGNSIGAKLHVADNRSTAYSSTGEPAETIIAHNKNGSDGSGVNNYASLAFAVADGATSQGFLNYKRTGDNTGEFTFSQRTGSSSYAEHMKIENDGTVSMGGALQPAGNLTVGGSITSGTHLIQGVSNYTGLEVKGSGGSRPQVKWSNVNNGVIGSIYGTEGNALVLTSGTGGDTALTLDSSQNATFAGNVGVGQATPQTDNSTARFLHIGDSGDGSAGLVIEDNERQWEIQNNGSLNFMSGTTNMLSIRGDNGNSTFNGNISTKENLSIGADAWVGHAQIQLWDDRKEETSMPIVSEIAFYESDMADSATAVLEVEAGYVYTNGFVDVRINGESGAGTQTYYYGTHSFAFHPSGCSFGDVGTPHESASDTVSFAYQSSAKFRISVKCEADDTRLAFYFKVYGLGADQNGNTFNGCTLERLISD